jgi:DNA-binding IclR family transcriptional regulator
MSSALTTILKALANINRRRVYQIICRRASGRDRGITIEEICRASGMKQPAVSHCVAHLARAGLVRRTKARWWVHCTPSRDGLAALAKFVRDPGAYPSE